MKRGNGRCKWFSDSLAAMTTSKCNERRKTVIIRLYYRENCHRSREEQQQEYPLSKWQLQTWRREAMGKSSHDVTATDVREWRDDGKILLSRVDCRRDVERDDVKILLRRHIRRREERRGENWLCPDDCKRDLDDEKILLLHDNRWRDDRDTRRKSSYNVTAAYMCNAQSRRENPLTMW